ncbi:uncharacterized protein ANIA_11421 [Aspergillus nidulans FGSC A4]|uniref:Uncharacterized protein n=1 Tax=Emericella nidulans (strain FGSC A4 / ATCC 38163 / CBS 112.46 / NRRL 194 / M139) TaxID=227321 RepID=C8V5Y2_EMENI|nr:hypothetical protein [Aspergillus nidulans FGSC A4]CBF74991.1 TPA: hypothetical protein ANIA_11421 [Aspergillus nidulans FGSC A4]
MPGEGMLVTNPMLKGVNLNTEGDMAREEGKDADMGDARRELIYNWESLHISNKGTHGDLTDS